MSSRRNFLKSAAMLSLGASMVPEAAFAASKKKAPKAKGGKSIGLQLYSVGPEVSGANTAEGLKRLREMGYTYVELAGFLGHSASELKKMTDDAGIKIMSTHLNPNTNGEKYSQANKQQIVDFWKKQIDEHASFGMKYIVQPGGSKKDNLSIEACDKLGVAMVFTGMRHFRH